MDTITHEKYMQRMAEGPAADMVNSPPHYNQGEIECIDAIKAALGEEGFKAYCRGNALKYTWRANHKGNHDQDVQKAIWYMNRIIQTGE